MYSCNTDNKATFILVLQLDQEKWRRTLFGARLADTVFACLNSSTYEEYLSAFSSVGEALVSNGYVLDTSQIYSTTGTCATSVGDTSAAFACAFYSLESFRAESALYVEEDKVCGIETF